MSLNFYRKLKTYYKFSDVFEHKNYTDIPSDWLIIASDVLGSTKAIEEGRYKEVNTIGASTIICVLNATEHHAICYQFGGDGALIATPPKFKDEIEKSLSYLKKLSLEQFNLSLRVGIWNKSDFEKNNYSFKVLKYSVSKNQTISMFSGTGVEVSDIWLKEQSEATNLFNEQHPHKENLLYTDGLECRWSPIASQRGQMVTGIIKNRENKNDSSSIEKIFHLLDNFGKKELIKPINSKKPPRFGSTKQYINEWKVRTYGKPLFSKVVIFITEQIKILLLSPYIYIKKDKINYIQELGEQTDFQKFDGLYKFVVDLNKIEYEILKDLCEKLHSDKKIFFGLQTSDTALMTCMFFSFSDHFHFVDGGNGGYALAAQQLKKQIKESL